MQTDVNKKWEALVLGLEKQFNDEMTLKWIIKAYENSTDKSKFFLMTLLMCA